MSDARSVSDVSTASSRRGGRREGGVGGGIAAKIFAGSIERAIGRRKRVNSPAGPMETLRSFGCYNGTTRGKKHGFIERKSHAFR